MNSYQEVNVGRERYIIYPVYTRTDEQVALDGYQLYDKDTEEMVYSRRRNDGLYNTEAAALIAAGLHQRQN